MLQFEKTMIKGEPCKFGSIQQYTLEVTNPSEEEIAVNSLQPGCSCTQAYLNPNPVPGNSKAQLKLTLDTKKAGIGDLVKSVNIKWNHKGRTYTEVINLKVHVSRS